MNDRYTVRVDGEDLFRKARLYQDVRLLRFQKAERLHYRRGEEPGRGDGSLRPEREPDPATHRNGAELYRAERRRSRFAPLFGAELFPHHADLHTFGIAADGVRAYPNRYRAKREFRINAAHPQPYGEAEFFRKQYEDRSGGRNADERDEQRHFYLPLSDIRTPRPVLFQ